MQIEPPKIRTALALWADDLGLELSQLDADMLIDRLRALSTITPAEVGGLVERLRGWDHCWPAPGLENAVAEAASTLTTISTRNAELEREVKRLREAVDLLETANSLRRNSMGDVNYDTFYDGPSVEDLEERAHALSTAQQGGDHGE